MICVGRNAHTKSCPKTFRASLGKFGQKSFAPLKFACSYTYGLNNFKEANVLLPAIHRKLTNFLFQKIESDSGSMLHKPCSGPVFGRD